MTLFQLALTFFLVTNPIGNSPAVLALVKDFDFKKQRWILLREGFFSFLIALFFQYVGEQFLTLVKVHDYSMTLCGGTLLLLIAFQMIFPKHEESSGKSLTKEPFIVPIATPLLSGPGVLSLIMLFAKQEQNNLLITTAILIAWAGVIAVMGAAPYMQKVLGRRGLIALEQFMGMLLAVIASGMLAKGVRMFMDTIAA
jgi:multiple antibiotic resistance protein